MRLYLVLVLFLLMTTLSFSTISTSSDSLYIDFDYVYKDVYLAQQGDSSWTKKSCSGVAYDQNWYNGCQISTQGMSGTYFVATYACNAVGSGFDCNDNQWRVKQVNVGGDTSPAPTGKTLVPGNGFNGETPTPGQISNVKDPVIAHWAVIPEQEFSDTFQVGVYAYHLDGIDYVNFSVDGGPWLSVYEPSINPRTGSKEYWVTLDANSFGEDKEVEVRAVAYPNVGKPVVVKPLGATGDEREMTLFANAGGSLEFPVIELDAGTHTVGARRLPQKGWLTIKPKPGLSRNQVVVTDRSQWWGSGRVKFEGVTIKDTHNNFVYGNANPRNGEIDDTQLNNHVWLDNVKFQGNGVDGRVTTGVGYRFETLSFTNSQIYDIQRVFAGGLAIKSFARNLVIDGLYEDFANSGGVYADIVIENVDREPLVEAKGLKGNDRPHPDIFQLQNMHNTIIQNLVAIDNINGQGIFPHDITDVAISDVNIKTPGVWGAFAINGRTKNVIVEDSNFDGDFRLRDNFEFEVIDGSRLVIRNTVHSASAETLNQPGVVIIN